jgi:hypothetical protein
MDLSVLALKLEALPQSDSNWKLKSDSWGAINSIEGFQYFAQASRVLLLSVVEYQVT